MPWITAQVAFAGAGITPENYGEIARHGFGAIVNLRSEHQDSFAPPFPLAYLWLPIEDHTAPTPGQLLIGVQFIHTAVQMGYKVLIHCKMGIHRSATLAVAYLIYTGLSKEAAIAKLAENGPRLYGSEEDQRVLENFIALLAATLPPPTAFPKTSPDF